MKNKFSKPPLSKIEKEKKAIDFVNFASEQKTIEVTKTKENHLLTKEPTVALILRIPESFKNDIKEIMRLTGLSINAVCLELLRPAIKKKLKELKED